METKWKKSFSQLAKEHGCAISALKHWSKSGHDLDNQELVTSLVAQWKVRHDSPNAPGIVSKASSALTPRVLSLDNSLGLLGALNRLRQAELSLSEAYTVAVQSGNSSAFSLRKEWLDVQEALRKAEMSSPDVLEANKKAISLDEVDTVLTKLFSRLRTDLESLPARSTKELPQDIGQKVFNSLTADIARFIEKLYRNPLMEDDE